MANDLILKKDSKIKVDLPSGWKEGSLVDNWYSEMSTIRVKVSGSIKTVPTKRIKKLTEQKLRKEPTGLERNELRPLRKKVVDPVSEEIVPTFEQFIRFKFTKY